LSQALSNGVAANDVGISPTANGMADAYATFYGNPADAFQVGICGEDGRKNVRTDPEMFKLAGSTGRLGNCGGGGVSPFKYLFLDRKTGKNKEVILAASTRHQFDHCNNIDNIKLQPNLHFKKLGLYDKNDWVKGYKLSIIDESIDYFDDKHIDTDIVLYGIENSYISDLLPDGTKRVVPPIITHLDRRYLPDIFTKNKSIVIGTSKDLANSPTERFYEMSGDGVSSPKRFINEFSEKKLGLMATNYSAFYRLSGSPMYLMNNVGNFGLFGIMKSTATFKDDKKITQWFHQIAIQLEKMLMRQLDLSPLIL